MADPVTGALVSGLVKVVIDKLGTPVIQKLSRIYGVKSQLPKLKSTLAAIDAVLQDAEEKQYSDKTIRNWLANLQDVVYDIDDLLDWVSTEHLKDEVNGRIWRQMGDLYHRYGWAQKLENICNQLETIQKAESSFNLRGYQSPIPVDNPAEERETSSHVVETDVHGREEDKDLIISRLVSPKNEKFVVIPIIGMGGIGKSTLVKMVLMDHRVKLFGWRLWAYVSRKFVLSTVIGNIIQSATGENCSNMNLQGLQNRLHEILAGQTFLLVLDDVWVEDLAQWEKLRDLLMVGSRGAILVTTRGEKVASITGTTKAYRVEGLSHVDCWSIFVKCAFEKGEEETYPSLVMSGRSIVEKCKGVALAVKTLGGSLRDKRDLSFWKKIEESELWRIDQGSNGILPALKLSFDHAPSHVKSCFAYCVLFGKGYPLQRRDIINMWTAQGLLQDQDGENCFDELLSRSFFQLPGYGVAEKHFMELARKYEWEKSLVTVAQRFKNNMVHMDSIIRSFTNWNDKLFVVEMHDLMHDLAAYVAGVEIANVSSDTREISEKARHIVWDKEDLSGKEFPKGLLKASKARTSIFLHPMGSLSKSFLESLLSSFKCLRVLMLVECEFEVLPDLIGDLKHLRLLDVCLNPKLKGLPNAICKLANLQVLDFGNCTGLLKLPKEMHRLVSLRTLIVTSTAACLPKKSFHCWNSLRTLSIIKCPNLTSLPEGMGNLKSLRTFTVWYCSSLAYLPNDVNQLTSLEVLEINRCEKLDLAQWDGLSGLQNLEALYLIQIPKLVDIPRGFQNVGPSLREFTIDECEALISLPEGLEHCTSLLRLRLYDCCKLNKLPMSVKSLVSLKELSIRGCSLLSLEWHLIAHIPHIYTDGPSSKTKFFQHKNDK